jgi:hypothetical protein
VHDGQDVLLQGLGRIVRGLPRRSQVPYRSCPRTQVIRSALPAVGATVLGR